MLDFLIEDSPRSQLIAGVFYLTAGLILLPTMKMMIERFLRWFCRPQSSRPGWRLPSQGMERFPQFALGLIVFAGAARLVILFLVQVGLMGSPWT